ncbi:hypothetical protein EYC56_11865 [Xanthomonas oryzae]|nr:hypothetical protein EYC56_11865 [Xanthomonas oryzae]
MVSPQNEQVPSAITSDPIANIDLTHEGEDEATNSDDEKDNHQIRHNAPRDMRPHPFRFQCYKS